MKKKNAVQDAATAAAGNATAGGEGAVNVMRDNRPAGRDGPIPRPTTLLSPTGSGCPPPSDEQYLSTEITLPLPPFLSPRTIRNRHLWCHPSERLLHLHQPQPVPRQVLGPPVGIVHRHCGGVGQRRPHPRNDKCLNGCAEGGHLHGRQSGNVSAGPSGRRRAPVDPIPEAVGGGGHPGRRQRQRRQSRWRRRHRGGGGGRSRSGGGRQGDGGGRDGGGARRRCYCQWRRRRRRQPWWRGGVHHHLHSRGVGGRRRRRRRAVGGERRRQRRRRRTRRRAVEGERRRQRGGVGVRHPHARRGGRRRRRRRAGGGSGRRRRPRRRRRWRRRQCRRRR